jgi:predicted  nucleic acid-binding Zn-ribbon protein
MEQIRIAILNPYNKVLAFLDNTVPNAMHYFDEILHTYLKGSSYTFEFTTMTAHDDAVFLVEGNKISFKRKGKDYHLTIMSVEKGGDTTTVTAYGLCLELTNEYVDAYKATKAMSFEEYINAYGFERSFIIGKNEVSNKKITHEWTGTDTVLARLYSIANVFDAELEFVTELNDDYSLKNVVLNIYRAHSDSVQGIGNDKRSTILRYPNDVYGITKTSDITELYTAIRPTGTNGLQLNSISGRTVKDSNGNVLYKVNGNNILAPQSRDRFPSTLITNHSNDMYAVQIWSYETENVETLYGQALAQLKKNCVPKVTYDVDAYIDADIGDTFTIEDAEYNPTLYLEARITEQEICFTDTEKCKTIFDNFEEKQSQISSALISEMNKMIELKKIYEGSIVSTNGVLLKTDSDSTKLTALVKDDGVDITSKYSIIWYKDDEQMSTSQTITVSASDFVEKAVYRFKAMNGEILKATAEVTVMRLQDGQNGTSAYVHIAYANSSDGRVDFSLADSNRKFIGQYSDSKQYGSDDPTKYRWSAIKGEDGQSFVSAEEQFYYSTSQTELIGGEWFVGNVVYQSDKFLWKRWKCTYANPSEIKYTKAIFDNTWNEIDSKIGEIHTQVSQANTQSKEAVDKATQAQTDASKANQLANTANTQSSEAKQLAQDANTSTGKAQKQIDAIKGDITDSKQQIQDAVDKANANASEIATVKETYATKVELTNESKTIHADVTTEIEKKVGELSTTVSQTYASKSDLTTLEGSMNTQFKQTADTISTHASSIEKLQSDTTQAQKDITDATKKATDAQTQADKALGNAQSAQALADQAKQKADSAQENLDNANKELADAKKNLESVTGRVDSSEKEISDAKTRLSKAESDVTQAQKDAITAQGKAQTAINNAKAAQSTADTAKANADKAQKDLADLTNKVTSNTTAIEQNSKAIKLQATSVTEIKGVANTANSNASSALNKANSLTDRANSGEFDGRGVASTIVEYQASTSGTTVPTGTWSSTPPKTTADKPYLWTRTVITYSDNTQSTSYSVGSTPEGIVVGGRNLILNSKDLTIWNKESGISVTQEGEWFKVLCSAHYSSRWGIYTDITVEPNTTYTLSVYCKNGTNAPYVGGGPMPKSGLSFGYNTGVSGAENGTRYINTLTTGSSHDIWRIYLCIIPTATGQYVYFKLPKLEIGNKATDWTPAPEDVDNAINEESITRQSAIETKANEITSKVSETYVSNSAFEHYQNTVSSQFTQTKKDFTWSINQSVTDAKNEMNGQIGSVNGRVDGLKETTDNVNNYMSFDKDGLTLGKSDSAFKTKITNQEWSIQKNGAKVTYINDQTMYITDGQFTQSLKIGNFGFVPRANGSLDFKKIR